MELPGIMDNSLEYVNTSLDYGYDGEAEDYTLYKRLATTLYYLFLLPVAFIGNVLTVVVVTMIVRHQRTRRSIPDVCLGALACVDLLSVVLIHSVSASVHAEGLPRLPGSLCVYQAFMASLYLKMQFMLQVVISVDRHLALVRPLTYHRFSSLRTTKIILFILLLIAVTSSTLTLVLDRSRSTAKVKVLETWTLCLFSWQLHSIADYVLVGLISAVFVAGFVAFIVCNVTLVKILWHYNTKRAQMVFQGISDAVNAMNRGPVVFASPPAVLVDNVNVKGPPNGPQNSNGRLIGGECCGGETQSIHSANENCCAAHSRRDQSSHADATLHGPWYHKQTSLPGNSNIKKCKTDYGGTSVSLPNDINTHGQTNYGSHTPMCSEQTPLINGATHNANRQSSEDKRRKHNATSELEHSQSDSVTKQTESTTFYVGNDEVGSSSSPPYSSPIPAIVIEAPSYHSDSEPESSPQHQHQQKLLSILSKRKTKLKKSVSFQDQSSKEAKCRIPISKSEQSFHKRGSLVSWHSSVNSQDSQKKSSSTKSSSSHCVHAPVLRSAQKHTLAMRRNQSPPHIVINGSEDRVIADWRTSPKTATPIPGTQFQHFQDQVRKVLKKLQRKADQQKKEILLAKLVVLCASLFVLTWTPYVVLVVLSMFDIKSSPIIEDLAIKLIFSNAVVNPLFYGLCRRNYRKGYDYVTQAFCHYMSFGCVEKPGEEKVFYESRRRKQKRHMAIDVAMEAHNLANYRRRRSAPAIQILQQTLALRSASPRSPVTPAHSYHAPVTPGTAGGGGGAGGTPGTTERSPPRLSCGTLLRGSIPRTPSTAAGGTPSFMPSKRLQELFERYMEESSHSSESSTSSIDYDALLFDGDEGLAENLKRVWSMYIDIPDLSNEDIDDDIDLDVDYDTMVEGGGIPMQGLNPNPQGREARSTSVNCEHGEGGRGLFTRLARSTPNFLRQLSSNSWSHKN